MNTYLILFKYVLDRDTQDNVSVIKCDHIEYQGCSISFYEDGMSLPDLIVPLEAVLYIRRIEDTDITKSEPINDKFWLN